jgi:hypothetical protein
MFFLFSGSLSWKSEIYILYIRIEREHLEKCYEHLFYLFNF